MKETDFEAFNGLFKPTEKWGDYTKVQWYHVHQLYQIRKAISAPMVIHCSYEESGHSPKSYHYRGLATDFHIMTNMAFKDQAAVMLQTLEKLRLSDFCGIGFYPSPEWHTPGFHFDSRGESVMWVKHKGKYLYGLYSVKQVLGF